MEILQLLMQQHKKLNKLFGFFSWPITLIFFLIFFDEIGHFFYATKLKLKSSFGYYCYDFKLFRIKILFFISIEKIKDKNILKKFYISGFMSAFLFSVLLIIISYILKLKLFFLYSTIVLIIHLITNLLTKESDLKNYIKLNKLSIS